MTVNSTYYNKFTLYTYYIVHCQHAMLYIYSISIKLGRGIGDLKSVEKEKGLHKQYGDHMSVLIQSCCDDLPVVIRTVLRKCLAYVSEAAVHGWKVHLEGDRDTWLSTILMDFSGTEMSFPKWEGSLAGTLLEILFWWCCDRVIPRKAPLSLSACQATQPGNQW